MVPTLVLPRVLTLSAAAIVLLDARGGLPKLPEHIIALTASERRRDPTLTELERYEWCVVEERGARFTGVMALREEFDLHANADILRVDHLVGSRRACVMLLRHLGELSVHRDRLIVGNVDVDNMPMARLAARCGLRPTRFTFTGRG